MAEGLGPHGGIHRNLMAERHSRVRMQVGHHEVCGVDPSFVSEDRLWIIQTFGSK